MSKKKAEMLVVCPHCHSENIEYKDWEYDEEHAFRDVECNECGTIWSWIFDFVETVIVYKPAPNLDADLDK